MADAASLARENRKLRKQNATLVKALRAAHEYLRAMGRSMPAINAALDMVAE